MAPRRPNDGFRPRLLVAVAVGPALNPLNSTMIAVALQPAAVALGIPLEETVWLIISLYVASAIALPLLGGVGDRFGHRRVYVAGMLLVTVASILPVLWPTYPVSIAARALIGVGTSAAIPSTLGVIAAQAARSGQPAPPRALAAVSLSAMVAIAIGPVLAGPMIVAFGWQSVFWVNIPLAAIGALMGVFWLPRDEVRRNRATHRGAGDSGPAWALPRPTGALVRTYTRIALLFVSVYSFVFGVVPWTQHPYGIDIALSGFVQLPAALTAIACGMVMARTRRIRSPLLTAGTCGVIGAVIVAALHGDSPVWVLLAASAVLGVSQGFGFAANQNALYTLAPAERVGAAAGIGRVSMYVGAVVSAGAVGAVYGDQPTTAGLHALALAMLVCAVGTLALTIFDRGLPRTLR